MESLTISDQITIFYGFWVGILSLLYGLSVGFMCYMERQEDELKGIRNQTVNTE